MLCINRNKASISSKILQNILNIVSKSKNFKSSLTLDVQPYKLHRLEKGPDKKVTVTKEDALKYYEQMQTIRQFEQEAAALYKEKAVRGFCHLYNGQEAVAVGMKAAMGKKDTIITSYRAHGWTYLMGISVLGVLAELTGRKSGCARGKGGSMHMYAPRFYGGNGIVGAQVPLGTGIAFALKYQGESAVSFTLYGDGAANQGQVAEALNIAGLWKLPAVYVCENNKYGMGTSVDRHSLNTKYYTRGDRVPGIWVDGMDVLAVRNATKFAINHANKKGPIIMEVFTYRYYGHSMSDPGVSYRSREEIQEVREKRDPIAHFRRKCVQGNLISEEECKKIDTKIKADVRAAGDKSKTDKEVPLAELTYDIAYNYVGKYVRGVAGQKLKHDKKGKAVNI